MGRAEHYWPAQTAAALCVASRWVSAASLLLTLFAFAMGAAFDVPSTAPLAALIAAGGVQVYLAVRIEFDRRVFELAASEPEGFAGFDDSGRSAKDRAAGLARLVRWHGALLAAQLVLAVASLMLA